MNMRNAQQQHLIDVSSHHVPGRLRGRRRKLLGIVLVVAGTAWLWLRLTSLVGNLAWTIAGSEGALVMLERIDSGDGALLVSLATCGMLAVDTIRRPR